MQVTIVCVSCKEESQLLETKECFICGKPLCMECYDQNIGLCNECLNDLGMQRN